MRVLLVEDDADLGAIVKRSLGEDGFQVDLVESGLDAFRSAMTEPYAAIVLDIMLPGLDGFEVCKKLRDKECWTPILLATARSDVLDRVEGLDLGADDYLVKPFNLDELSARVRALIRRGKPARPTVLNVGNLRLDPANHRVWRNEVELTAELSPKEFALLELFMRNPGQVLLRSRIIDSIWGFDDYTVSNVVDQYVSYLRRKIDRPFQRNDIETIRGVGYRLKEA